MESRRLDVEQDNKLQAGPDTHRRILEFWHKVEFFIPYDLEKQVLDHKDKDWAVRRITREHLQSIQPHDCGNLWQVARPPQGKRVYGFDLFLGIFDKAALSQSVKAALNHQPSDIEATEDFERGDYEGLTCIAKIGLNAHGEPQFDAVSVSTAPWAMGRLQARGTKGLDFESFEAGIERLKHTLADFKAQRLQKSTEQSDADETAAPPMPLSRDELEKLVDVFCNWAGFTPDVPEVPVVVVRAKVANDPAKKQAPPADSSKPIASSPGTESAEAEADDSEEEVDADDEIDILNSFYVKDIQRVLKSMVREGLSPSLKAYLTPLPLNERTSVYSEDGRNEIRDRLHPVNLPSAHWLGESTHYMSLMQQFAINQSAEAVKTRGIFAVNGPPGTGKTTLLRDIFAEIITQRARVLSKLSCASAAFGDKVSVEFHDADGTVIGSLIEELTGFEIVVASTNNAAVENISQDLPKATALGSQKSNQRKETDWRKADGEPKATYLRPIAIKYAARNSKGELEPLNADDRPWGLIACSLGRWSNRERFFKAVFDPTGKEEARPKGYDESLHQSIWEWRQRYQGPSFQKATELFKQADAAVSERQRQLAQYADAFQETSGFTIETYTRAAREKVEASENAWLPKKKSFTELSTALSDIESQLKDIDRLKSTNEQPKKLSILKRIFSGSARRKYAAEIEAYEEKVKRYKSLEAEELSKKIEIKKVLPAAQSAMQEAETILKKHQRCLRELESRWRELQDYLAHHANEFPEVVKQLGLSGPLAGEQIQKEGLWPDPKLNALRSQLFAAALVLHEAWLAEASTKGKGFGGNIFALSSFMRGKRLQDSSHAKLLWQSLFMIVPVVSSTFASMANQFKDLGAASLGWLFIDEAGQAVPQAAVGALWRSRRALVVGDPLQIEPVFTVPAKLIEELEKSSNAIQQNVAPHKRSVQNLADESTGVGAEVSNSGDSSGNTWIGSPLRVHRRCADPMFEAANAIAYEGKMIFGASDRKPPSDSINLGDSAWVHVPGAATDKQVVPEQIELVVQGIIALARSLGELPPVYLISPFRRIASELRERLGDIRCWGDLRDANGRPLAKATVQKWCRSNIGTVHTFQGKQAPIVWMILGCDSNTPGAVSWASGKPNILNVALTRAEHRFFVIGDANVWGGKSYFKALRPPAVPRISRADFIQRIEAL